MTARVVDVMDAAGKEVIILETVGTGQSEVEVAEIAQTKVVGSALRGCFPAQFRSKRHDAISRGLKQRASAARMFEHGK